MIQSIINAQYKVSVRTWGSSQILLLAIVKYGMGRPDKWFRKASEHVVAVLLPFYPGKSNSPSTCLCPSLHTTSRHHMEPRSAVFTEPCHKRAPTGQWSRGRSYVFTSRRARQRDAAADSHIWSVGLKVVGNSGRTPTGRHSLMCRVELCCSFFKYVSAHVYTQQRAERYISPLEGREKQSWRNICQTKEAVKPFF